MLQEGRVRIHFVTITLVMLVAMHASLDAQQYVTDDASLTDFRACAFQMWHGQRASWLQPACTPVTDAELSIGFVAVWRSEEGAHFEYEAQVKTLLKPLETNSWGVGLVAGTGRHPAFAGVDSRGYSIFSYVPVSVSVFGDRLELDENTGWIYERRASEGGNAITWALRADVGILKYVALINEVYGAKGVGSNAPNTPAEFQTGVRVWLRADRVELDASYGGTLRTGRDGAGWTLGLTLLTPPFL